jgi:hypothetical protein
MDRKKLVELFRRGLQYPSGKHRFWVSRCFEITVHPDKVVDLDEYEGFASETGKPARKRQCSDMFHVGRSVLDLKDGTVVEERGDGWKNPLKKGLTS